MIITYFARAKNEKFVAKMKFVYMAAGKPTAMATKKKKIVSKDDLRRLMREKQTTAKITGKKIEHPFAKYGFYLKLCPHIFFQDV